MREPVLLVVARTEEKSTTWGDPSGVRQHELASIAKVFTAAAVLVLQEEKGFSLDEPCSTERCGANLAALPGERLPSLRELLCHTSGYEGEAGSPRPVAPPGVRFRYSNANYALLAEVLERLTGEPWPESLGAALANDGADPRWFRGGSGPPGAMGLAMTTADLEAAARWLATSGLADRLAVEGCETFGGRHAAGWTVVGEGRGRRDRFAALGSAPGAGVDWRYDPREGRSLILLTPTRYSPPFFEEVLARAGEPYSLANAPRAVSTALPADELAELAVGRYASAWDEGRSFVVTQADGSGLMIEWGDANVKEAERARHESGTHWRFEVDEEADETDRALATFEDPEIEFVHRGVGEGPVPAGVLLRGEYFRKAP